MDPSRFAHRSLEDFERLYVGVGPENYGWYQVKLHVGAKRIYDSGGIDALSRMWRTFALGPDLLSSILETEVDPEARATRARVASRAGESATWSIYEAHRSQPVAIGGRSEGVRNRSIRRKPLPWVATGCREERMGRRRSIVPRNGCPS
jgi:hypothetical protein